MGLGKLKLHTKFEVASFSRCKNIKGELQNLGELPSPWPHPLFPLGVILRWALANPSDGDGKQIPDAGLRASCCDTLASYHGARC